MLSKKDIEELRDSYELHQRKWAKRCLDNIEKEIKELQSKANKYDSLVEKIKDKIEELKQELAKVEQMSASATRYDVIQKLNNQINILQELIKKIEA